MRDELKLKKKIDAIANDARADPNIRKVARSKSAAIKPVLQHIIVQVARPRPSAQFYGRVEEAKYSEDDGFVQLYSMEDRSLGRKFRRKIVPPLNARETAAILLRSKVDWRSSSFNRKIIYPKGL